MRFINHTPFPAAAFEGIDQHDQRFHVVVMRQTLTWDDAGEVFFAAGQQPLCEEDEFFGPALQSSVRQESDLCPYKPRCDVIVNATAYPPRGADGHAPDRFAVRVVVSRPGVYPEADVGAGGPAISIAASERLIDKTLVVIGERCFIKRPSWQRVLIGLTRIATLGAVRPSSWRITHPMPADAVPIRLEQAFGGQCRIDADDEAAGKVSAKHRLSPEQANNHPDAADGPVAHDAYIPNPLGRGFTRNWYIAATATHCIDAPRLEHPDLPITIAHFNRIRAGDTDAALVAGLGVRPKAHPERAKLLGTVDDTFIRSGAALPKDFDFAMWNAAWPDQQVHALTGDERIDLMNLCVPGTPAAKRDSQGNIALRLRLPGHLPFVLVRFKHGAIGELAARLDTLVIDPDRRELTCIWRATISKEPVIRVLEARMLDRGHHPGPPSTHPSSPTTPDSPDVQETGRHG